jgi:carbon monoxide dehydrogenase subunit G
MLGPHFATAHTMYMGSSAHEKGSFYSFGTTLVLGDALLIGRFDHLSRVDAQWHQTYPGAYNRWSHRIQAQLTPQETHGIAEFERKGDTHTAGVKLGVGSVGLSYFQAVTPRLALGGEVSHLRKMGATHVTARARYTDNNHTFVCTATTMGSVSAAFLRRVSNRLGLACELEVATANMNSHMSVGAEFIMRQAKFHANITSTGIIQTTLQDVVGNNVFLLLSAIVDHRNDQYRFGAGVQLG